MYTTPAVNALIFTVIRWFPLVWIAFPPPDFSGIYFEFMTNLLRIYIQNGERIEVNIPFPEIHKQIVGVLAIRLTELVVVKLTKEQ